ncbi:PadR family transcriptional regulator [Pseudonocardia alaniniphila]|uniref:PadR family transcriptional regulator n=1 Tax=Pseudonocardia alaniniphila TaxID=75291 RepID=A0ABS9TV49_9PSEU|nr:PadR family transcriptional regulator [Pseudonocardia alaniniphila]MCH6172372.1 PadR family transcriptional regulator [Pseudonocardia alaniniphila]
MSLCRSDRDLVALAVLALLLSGPRYRYEMHRVMIETHDDFVTGLPRSLYHAVDRLLDNELIRVVGTDRRGRRPEHAVLGLTDAGRVDLMERVRRLLEHPDPDSTLLIAALSFAGCLPISEASAALHVRTCALEYRASETRRRLALAFRDASRMPRSGLEYEIARLDAERAWVFGLIEEIDADRLDDAGKGPFHPDD